MIETARRSALHALDRAEALLAIAGRASMLEARLAPGMFDLEDQLRVTASMAMRSVLPPMALPVPELADDMPAADALAAARQVVSGAEGAPVERVAHRAGFADLEQSTEAYIATFALPNLWFHVAMAYAILRAEGVAVGKAEYDGLHAYPEGFRFDV